MSETQRRSELRRRNLKLALAGGILFIVIGWYVVDNVLLVRTIMMDFPGTVNSLADGSKQADNDYYGRPEIDQTIADSIRSSLPSELLLAAHGIGTILEHDPRSGTTLITKMIALAVSKQALLSVLHLVNEHRLPRSVLIHLYRGLQVMRANRIPLSLAFKTENEYIMRLGDYLAEIRCRDPGAVKERMVSFFRRKALIQEIFHPFHRAMIEAADRPYPDGRECFEAVHRDLIRLSKQVVTPEFYLRHLIAPRKGIMKILAACALPNGGRAYHHVVELEALTRIVLVRLLLERFSSEFNGYPRTLTGLNIYGAGNIVLDPFNPEQPLDYGFDGHRYVLESVGGSSDSGADAARMRSTWSR